jgi:exonuclease SbcC
MEILESIVIKNIRRFGEETTIKLSPGATIFYAPNGTGKTSIFEAIELALTGKVKRLHNDFKPLMRDNSTDSSVRLNFLSGHYCQANLQQNSPPNLSGDYDALFKNTPKENVSFLLRLTHLLNQSADGWFVQSRDTNDAGQQLGYLSIERDAAQAKSIMTGATRAATELIRKNQDDLANAQEGLTKWTALLEQRNANIDLGPNRPLESLEKLFDDINRIALLFNHNKLVYNEDIYSIRNQYDEVIHVINQKRDEESSKLIKLNAIIPIVQEYLMSSKLSADYRRTIVSATEARINIEYALAKLEIELANEQSKLKIFELSLGKSQDRLNKMQRSAELQASIADLSAQIHLHKAQVEEITEVYNSAKKVHTEASAIVNEYKLHFEKEVGLAKRKSSLLLQLEAIEDWRKLNESIAQLVDNIHPASTLECSTNREALKALNDQKDEQSILLAETQRAFDAINIANDAIINAIGIIVSELPTQVGTCPVCTQEYEPAELHRRMNVALNAINPELHHTASKLDGIRARLSRLDKRIADANNKLVKSIDLLDSTEKSIVGLQNDRSRLRDTRFPGIESVEQAAEQCQRAIAENEAALQELSNQKSLLPPEPSSETLAIIKNTLDNIDFGLNNAAETMRALERTRDKALSSINNEVTAPSIEEWDAMISIIKTESASIANTNLAIDTLNKEIEQQTNVLNAKSLEMSSLNRMLMETNANLNQYKTQWSLLKISEEPSEEILRSEITSTQSAINDIEERIEYLEQFEIEINRRLSIAENSIIDKEINKVKGTLSAIEYSSSLTTKINNLNKKRELLLKKDSTLKNFSLNLGKELKGIHEIIESINPLWNKLLKRIVIDPRFSETVLKSFSSRNKPHANVKVPLHGENTSAHYVASEAQITDLQLTFLLALAQNYEWTPWRALLLDDPTQHHDLVHASAVFDLLRDYIAENNFQVLLATHDSVQAKFFMRKLQNDGIPARICTLQATSTGVISVCKEW